MVLQYGSIAWYGNIKYGYMYGSIQYGMIIWYGIMVKYCMV